MRSLFTAGFAMRGPDVIGIVFARRADGVVGIEIGCGACHARGKRRFVLPCEHVLCAACAFIAACPLCGREHDVLRMAARVRAWRGDYRAWRRGLPRGARDMEAIQRRDPVAVQRTRSCPT